MRLEGALTSVSEVLLQVELAVDRKVNRQRLQLLNKGVSPTQQVDESHGGHLKILLVFLLVNIRLQRDKRNKLLR